MEAIPTASNFFTLPPKSPLACLHTPASTAMFHVIEFLQSHFRCFSSCVVGNIRRRCGSSSDGRIAGRVAALLIDWLVANRHFNIDIAMGGLARGCAAVSSDDDIIPKMIAHQALLFGGLHTDIMDPIIGSLDFFGYTHRTPITQPPQTSSEAE